MALIDELRRYQRYAHDHKHVPPMTLIPAELDEIIAAVEVAEAAYLWEQSPSCIERHRRWQAAKAAYQTARHAAEGE